MEQRDYIIELYDTYYKLLTEKQRTYFEDYYYMDLSLSEIADNNNISKNAVFDQIKRTTAALNDYEDKLGLVKKYKKIDELEIDNDIKNKILNILKEE